MNDEILKRLANQAVNDLPYDNPIFPPSNYYRFMKRLNEYKKANLSVELGVCGGGGSFHLAIGNPNGTIVGVDLQWGEWGDNIKYALKECPNFHFFLGDSIEFAQTIYDRFGTVGILMIDTVHTYPQTILEFETWFPFMEKEGVVLLDDLYRPQMRGVWEYLLRYGKGVRLDFLHPGSDEGGFGAIILEK